MATTDSSTPIAVASASTNATPVSYASAAQSSSTANVFEINQPYWSYEDARAVHEGFDMNALYTDHDQRDEYIKRLCGPMYAECNAEKYPAYLFIGKAELLTKQRICTFMVSKQPDSIVDNAILSDSFFTAKREGNRLKLIFTSEAVRNQIAGRFATYNDKDYKIHLPNAINGKSFFDIDGTLPKFNLPELLHALKKLQYPIYLLQYRDNLNAHPNAGDTSALHDHRNRQKLGMIRVYFPSRKIPTQCHLDGKLPTYFKLNDATFPIYFSSEYTHRSRQNKGPRPKIILDLDSTQPVVVTAKPSETTNTAGSGQAETNSPTNTTTTSSTTAAPTPMDMNVDTTSSNPSKKDKAQPKRKQPASPAKPSLWKHMPKPNDNHEWEQTPSFTPSMRSSLPSHYNTKQNIEVANTFGVLADELPENEYYLTTPTLVQFCDEDIDDEQAIFQIAPPQTTAAIPQAAIHFQIPMVNLEQAPDDTWNLNWQSLPMTVFNSKLNELLATFPSPDRPSLANLPQAKQQIDQALNDIQNVTTDEDVFNSLEKSLVSWNLFFQGRFAQNDAALHHMINLHTIHRALIAEMPKLRMTSTERFHYHKMAWKDLAEFKQMIQNTMKYGTTMEFFVNTAYNQALALFEIITFIGAPWLLKYQAPLQSIIQLSPLPLPSTHRQLQLWDNATLFLLLQTAYGDQILALFHAGLSHLTAFKTLQRLRMATTYPVERMQWRSERQSHQ